MLIDNHLGGRFDSWKINQKAKSYSCVNTLNKIFVKKNLDAFALVTALGNFKDMPGEAQAFLG